MFKFSFESWLANSICQVSTILESETVNAFLASGDMQGIPMKENKEDSYAALNFGVILVRQTPYEGTPIMYFPSVSVFQVINFVVIVCNSCHLLLLNPCAA